MKKKKDVKKSEKRLEKIDERLIALLAERIRTSEKINEFYWNKEDRMQYEKRYKKNRERVEALIKKHKIKETFPIVYSLVIAFSRDHIKDSHLCGYK